MFITQCTRRICHISVGLLAATLITACSPNQTTTAPDGGDTAARLSSRDSQRWLGLSRATFADDLERQRTRRLLDLLDEHSIAHPERPRETPLFLMLKGDSESVAEANRRIAANETDHFAHGGELMPLLFNFDNQLTDPARSALENRIRLYLGEGGWHWTRKTGLYNINWAMSACNFLIVGGEWAKNTAAAEQGYAKMQAMFDRIRELPIGTVSEFNSPTYYGIDIGPMASIVEYSRSEKARIRARIMEERLGLDLASRHSPTIRQLAGPYSRVYQDSLVGATGITQSQMFKVFDESIFADFEVSLHYPHYWDLAFIPLIAFQHYHCPDYIRTLALEKKFPYEVRGTSASDPAQGFPFAFTDLHTYITDNWSLASNSRNWLHGKQNAACIAQWAKRQPVRTMKDFKVLYSRYQVNDSGPDVASLDQDERGRLHSVQDKGTILVGYKPKKKITAIRNLRLDIQIPLYDDVDELYVGHRPISPHAPNVATGGRRGNGHRPGADNRVYLRDGNIFVGILPLLPTDLGVVRPLRIRRYNGFLLISIYNRDSDHTEHFDEHTLDLCRNGFVLELADTSEFPTLNAFREHFDTGVVKDEGEGDVRSLSYTNGDQSMTLKYDMVTEHFVERTINGAPVEYPLFSSPHAHISVEGSFSVGRAKLTTHPGTYAWLIADEERAVYAAYNFSDHQTPMTMQTPAGTVKAESFGFGKIVYRPRGTPTLEVWAVDRDGPITFPAGADASVALNADDATSTITRQTIGGEQVLVLP